MLLKTGTYTDGGGFGRVGDQLGVGATWRKFQSCGVWASFPDVGMWGDMFLSFLEVGQERRKCSPPRNQFPSKEASSLRTPSTPKHRGPILLTSTCNKNSPVKSVQ